MIGSVAMVGFKKSYHVKKSRLSTPHSFCIVLCLLASLELVIAQDWSDKNWAFVGIDI